ncbi:MAG: radical SAM family heme chaperone HemW [Chloroflexi bacterium]|nr:radical SAM family heme chaperone HemW [Chloroflexota bacterium]
MSESIGLFVFIPFCKIKCTYCDFNVYANLARLMEPYAEAVAREITNHKLQITNAHSLYFGGGTPSLMPIASIEKILRALQNSFSLVSHPEITIEANPGNVDADQLRALRSLGINRLSLGVQSFDDAMLRRLNRGHTVADALQTFDSARRSGFDNLSLDFIYGLPLQSLDDWRATLERALALSPEHLSLYALKVEEGTGLEHQIKRGKYPKPDDDLEADMYELAEEMLDAAGYRQYEISNWARKIPTSNLQSSISNLQSRHNLTYWRNEPYFGFGAGAHSCFGGERFWNVLSPQEYIQRVERGESGVAGREQINRELEMAETMLLGLRLNEGIEFEKFAQRYGEDAREKYSRELREIRELGLVEISEARVRLTPRGRLLSNEVFWRFLP